MGACSPGWEAAPGASGCVQRSIAEVGSGSGFPQHQHSRTQPCALMQQLVVLKWLWALFKVQASTTAILGLYPGSVKMWLLV